jgi:HSP20 family molecular chaperone IbpA
MARDKKSLFDWLTGGATPEEDFSFDDLESGGSGGHATTAVPRHLESRIPDRHIVMSDPEPVEPEGELAVDVYQTPTHIIIKAMIAGVRPEDLDVSITRDMVTIRGKRERHTEGTASDFFFQELYWGAFTRTIVLTQEVEIE